GGGLGWTLTSNAKPVLGAARAVNLSIAAPQQSAGSGSIREGFADVIQPILPSVVNIQTTAKVELTQGRQGQGRGQGQSPQQSPFDDPFFRRFFGDPFG